MKVYLDFEIQISALGDARYALFVSGPGGDARATIGLPTAEPAYRALAERLARFETEEDDLIGLGQILFEALFQGPVKDVYTRSQSTLGPDEGLRLRQRDAGGVGHLRGERSHLRGEAPPFHAGSTDGRGRNVRTS